MKETTLMNFSTLLYVDFNFEILSVIRQYWDEDRKWSEFTVSPRFSSALLMVTADIEVRYTDHSGEIIDASYGDVIYIPYGALYNFEIIRFGDDCKPNQTKTLVINFNIIQADGKNIILAEKPTKVIQFHDSKLENDFQDMVNYSYLNPLPMMRKYKLYKIMASIIKQYTNNSIHNKSLEKAIIYLEENFTKDFKISILAEQCNMSESLFRKLFKEYTNKSPVEYRNQLRIEYAKELLSTKNMTIVEVAKSVGIDDQFYFSRIFKKSEGISPLQFKNQSQI